MITICFPSPLQISLHSEHIGVIPGTSLENSQGLKQFIQNMFQKEALRSWESSRNSIAQVAAGQVASCLNPNHSPSVSSR